jgi:membrane associated rhomboid family serine protease
MGIASRDYYRDSRPPGGLGAWGIYGITPVVKFLIVANIVVFLLQIFIVREVRLSPREMLRKINPPLDKLLAEKEREGPEAVEKFKKDHPEVDRMLSENDLDLLLYPEKVSIIQEWLELDTNKVIYGGQVWRLLTHAFCHDRWGVFHIFFNMLFLYWFGCTLESMYGSREFLLFYLTAAIVSALAFVGLELYTGSSTPAIGASGAVMGVAMLYTMHFPYETFCIFWTFHVEMRWIMLFYLIWDLHPVLLALAGDRFYTGIAHAGHLGGLAFGFLYAHYEWRLAPFADRVHWPRWQGRRRPRLRIAPETVPVHQDSAPNHSDERVDELLQKIYESGQASLTDEERAVLRSASERLKSKRTT